MLIFLPQKIDVDILKIVMSFQKFIMSIFSYMYIKTYLCMYKHIKSATGAVQTLNIVLQLK